jgi:GxxExxY protein
MARHLGRVISRNVGRLLPTNQECNRKAGRRFGDGSDEVIAACIEVHRHVGPGLLESVYERCLAHELSLRRLDFERQRALPVTYKGVVFEHGHRLDFVIQRRLIVEIKAVEHLLPVHEAQVLTYLKLSGLPTALLINFNVALLQQGLRRLTNQNPKNSGFPPPRLPVAF